MAQKVWEIIKTLFWALLIAGVFRTLLFQPFWIPSGSMKDTLLIGDFLFVNKFAYGYSYASCPAIRIQRLGVDIGADDACPFLDRDNTRLFASEPERGDIIVFIHPVNEAEFIKRLIGLPGDRIQMINGVLHLNGEAVALEDAGEFVETMERQGPLGIPPSCANDPIGLGGACTKTRQIETLPGGHVHNILDVGPRRMDDTREYTVPEGHYFFLGDNRDNSSDSRVPQIAGGVGYVPFENLIGRADRVVFSSAGSSMIHFWTWRRDRFFEKLE